MRIVVVGERVREEQQLEVEWTNGLLRMLLVVSAGIIPPNTCARAQMKKTLPNNMGINVMK